MQMRPTHSARWKVLPERQLSLEFQQNASTMLTFQKGGLSVPGNNIPATCFIPLSAQTLHKELLSSPSSKMVPELAHEQAVCAITYDWLQSCHILLDDSLYCNCITRKDASIKPSGYAQLSTHNLHSNGWRKAAATAAMAYPAEFAKAWATTVTATIQMICMGKNTILLRTPCHI